MKTIYKYPIPIDDSVGVRLPRGAKVLCVQMQHGEPTLWAEVDSVAKTEVRTFRIFGTGHEMPSGMGVDLRYIGTVQDREFVWHVYENAGV